MNLKDLKAYHAYYVMSVIFFLSCLFFRDMVFFPLGCAMICLGWVKQLKETGRIQGRPSRTVTADAAIETAPADKPSLSE